MNISNLDVEVDVAFDIGQFLDGYAIDSYFVGVSAISTDDGRGPRLWALDFLYTSDIPEFDGVRMGVGVKLISSNYNGLYFLSLPVGLDMEYRVFKNGIPFFATGSLFFAPISLSFSDAGGYFEFRTGVAYEVFDHMRILFDWRTLHTNYKTTSMLFNQTFYGGMRVGF